MDDLNFVFHEAMDLPADSDELVWHVLKAVEKGSKVRSPFWHASTSLSAAQRWRAMAETSGSQPSGSSVAIRIHIWEWYQSGKTPPHALIDLSTDDAQHRMFKKGLSGYGYKQEGAMQAMKYSLQTREVLLKWRGQFPLKYCDIVNDISGEVLANLADVMTYVSK